MRLGEAEELRYNLIWAKHRKLLPARLSSHFESVQSVELIGEIVAWVFRAFIYFLCCAVLGCCQAMAGSLYPTADPQVICYQRWTRALLSIAVSVFLFGVLLAYYFKHEAIGYAGVIASLVLMIVAGIFGSHAEQAARRIAAEDRTPSG